MVELQSKPQCVILKGELTIRAIDITHSTLVAALSNSSEIEIDCSEAAEVDLSLIQLLIAASRSAKESGKRLTMTQGADGALRAALVQGGFLPTKGVTDDAEAAFWLGAVRPS